MDIEYIHIYNLNIKILRGIYISEKLTLQESIYKSANHYIATIVGFTLFLIYGVIFVTLMPFLIRELNVKPHINRIDFYVENYVFWLIIMLSIVSLILVLFSFFFIKKLVYGNKAFKYIHLTKKMNDDESKIKLTKKGGNNIYHFREY